MFDMLNQARIQELTVQAQAAEHHAAWHQFQTIDRLESALTRAKSRLNTGNPVHQQPAAEGR